MITSHDVTKGGSMCESSIDKNKSAESTFRDNLLQQAKETIKRVNEKMRVKEVKQRAMTKQALRGNQKKT